MVRVLGLNVPGPREIEYSVTAADSSTYRLINKRPELNPDTNMHELAGYGDRVAVMMNSAKNFMLELEGEGVVLRFGKCGTDRFWLDYKWPLSPLQAFGVALSTFDRHAN